MTDKEYQQKKRECWEEFCKDPHLCDSHSLTKSTFNFAFDRAYALGKEKETITQEDIIKGGREAVRKEYLCEKCEWKNDCDLCGGENTAFDCCECPADSYEDGFKAGANFALGKQKKDADTVIQGWVARDSDGTLSLFAVKPERVRYRRRNGGLWMAKTMTYLIPELFPDLTWDSDPIEVELIIKRKKK